MDLRRYLRLFGKGEALYALVRDALEAFVCHRPEVGYMQGLSYVAAVLALFVRGRRVHNLSDAAAYAPVFSLHEGSEFSTTVAGAAGTAASNNSSSTSNNTINNSSAPTTPARQTRTAAPSTTTPLTAMSLSSALAGSSGNTAHNRQPPPTSSAYLEEVYLVFQCLVNIIIGTRSPAPVGGGAVAAAAGGSGSGSGSGGGLAWHGLTGLGGCCHLHDFFLLREDTMQHYYDLFDLALEETEPKLRAHLKKVGVTYQLFLFMWLQTVFLRVLPLNAAARVWDLFLLGGTPVLFRTAVAVLRQLKPKLMRGSFEQCLGLVTGTGGKKGAWAAFSTPEVLIPAIAKVNLSNRILGALNAVGRGAVFLRPRATPISEHPQHPASGASSGSTGSTAGGDAAQTPPPPRQRHHSRARARRFPGGGGGFSPGIVNASGPNAIARFTQEITTSTPKLEARRLAEALAMLGT